MSATLNGRPYSHTKRETARRWIFADLPWAVYGDHTGFAKIKFLIGRAARWFWYWRDISPGIGIPAVAWLWGHSPWRIVPFPILPLWFLVIVGAGITVASIRYDSNRGRTANKDRTGRKIKATFQKAWLDLCREKRKFIPIPDLRWPEVKDHVVNLHVEAVAGTSNREMMREILDKLPAIYKCPVKVKHHGDGSYTISIFQYDPLKQEPVLPAHLGNEEGPVVRPTWKAFPIGIGADGEILTVRLFEQNFLLPGAQRTGKSTTLAAIGVGLLATPNAEVWAIDPQVVSLRCLRNLVPFAGTVEAALELLRDFHESMQKRERQMDERETSLATPSFTWPLKVLLVDELLRLMDPDGHPIGEKYTTEFNGLVKDVLRSGPKTGHVVMATCTDPRRDILGKIAGLFSTRVIFRVVDGTEAGVAGANSDGFRAHELPETPGRCIVKDGKYRQCYTWGLWDQAAVNAAQLHADQLDQDQPEPAQQAEDGQIPPTDVVGSSSSGELSGLRLGVRTYGDARERILGCFHQRNDGWTAKEIAAAAGLSRSVIKYWLSSKQCPRRIPVTILPGHRYVLAGD